MIVFVCMYNAAPILIYTHFVLKFHLKATLPRIVASRMGVSESTSNERVKKSYGIFQKN